jgi:hypothetical protein
MNRAIALLYFLTFAPAAVEKFAGRETPAWFLKQFEPTILGIVPMLLPVQFFGIAVLEAVVAGLMLVALFKKKSDGILQAGLALSFLTFVMLSFGQRLSHKFDGAAELFFYAALTALIYRALFAKVKEGL